jgi:hypothetical protein
VIIVPLICTVLFEFNFKNKYFSNIYIRDCNFEKSFYLTLGANEEGMETQGVISLSNFSYLNPFAV